jgi:hypothetical protein
MQQRGWVAILLAAAAAATGCKSKGEAKATAGSGAVEVKVAEPAEPRLPEKSPFTLPTADPTIARRLGMASAFVTVDGAGKVALGPLKPAAADPYKGLALDTGHTLENEIWTAISAGRTTGGPAKPTPDPYDPYGYGGGGYNYYGYGVAAGIRVRGKFEMLGPVDVVVLADATAKSHNVIDTLSKLAATRPTLAVTGTGGVDVVGFRFQSIPRDEYAPAVAFVRVAPNKVTVRDRYGGEVPVLATASGGLDISATATAITAQLDPYGSSRIAEVTLASNLPLQTVVDALAAVAKAKLSQVTLVDELTDEDVQAMLASSTLKPNLTFGDPYITGGLKKSAVTKLLKDNKDKLLYCYAKQLVSRPDLEGTITVDIVVAEDGYVTGANGWGFDPEVSSCVSQALRLLTFPLSYPLTFTPTGG